MNYFSYTDIVNKHIVNYTVISLTGWVLLRNGVQICWTHTVCVVCRGGYPAVLLTTTEECYHLHAASQQTPLPPDAHSRVGVFLVTGDHFSSQTTVLSSYGSQLTFILTDEHTAKEKVCDSLTAFSVSCFR